MNPYYVSLRPVSDTKYPCKWLINKYLKQYFKFHRVFHRAVENPVENLQLKL